jgi:hypothetical protein
VEGEAKRFKEPSGKIKLAAEFSATGGFLDTSRASGVLAVQTEFPI